MHHQSQNEFYENIENQLSAKSRDIIDIIARTDDFTEESTGYWYQEVVAAGFIDNYLIELYNKCESDAHLVRQIILLVSVNNTDIDLFTQANSKDEILCAINKEHAMWVKIGRDHGIPDSFYCAGDQPAAVSLMATMLPDGYCLQFSRSSSNQSSEENFSKVQISILRGENKSELEYSTVYISRYSEREIPRKGQ